MARPIPTAHSDCLYCRESSLERAGAKAELTAAGMLHPVLSGSLK